MDLSTEEKLTTLICPYCAAKNGIRKRMDLSNSYECDFCGNIFFVKPGETDPDLRQAHNYLVAYRFEDADLLYATIVQNAKENMDWGTYVTAQWGRLLAEFGVVYVKSFDSTINNLVPTFAKYNKNKNDILSSEYYISILECNVSKEIKKHYADMAENLNKVYLKIKEEAGSVPEYDVFLCVKVSMKTENNPYAEGYTEDSTIADNLYEELRKNGIRVFYSKHCLQGVEYDSQILSALHKSKFLLVIGTKQEYLESVWVQSEWRRWLNFIRWGEKTAKSLLLYLPYQNVNPITLPVALSEKNVQYFTDGVKVVALLRKYCILDVKKETGKNNFSEFTDKAVVIDLKDYNSFSNNDLSAGSELNFNHVVKVQDFDCNGSTLKKYIGKGGYVFLPEHITEIAPRAFENCHLISQIIIKSPLEIIGDFAFANCTNLTSVVLPDSVTNIGKGAFNNCNSLVSVNIPPKVRDIPDGLFENCSKLKRIIIPENVITIGCKAFKDCSFLDNINLPIGLEVIGELAFYNCVKIKVFVIPSNVKEIGDNAFDGCTLNKITLPIIFKGLEHSLGISYTTEVLHAAFIDSKVYLFPNITDSDFICQNGILEKYTGKWLKVVIPEYVTEIGNCAFQGLNIISVVIPDSVKTIGEGAFRNCYRLTSVAIGRGVKIIGEKAFESCNNLVSIQIPSKLQSIEDYAFLNCSKLRKVKTPLFIPATGGRVFMGTKIKISTRIRYFLSKLGYLIGVPIFIWAILLFVLIVPGATVPPTKLELILILVPTISGLINCIFNYKTMFYEQGGKK